jgi:putative transposase
MKGSRFTETQIFSILKEAETGSLVKDVCRKHGISDATYYRWKSECGGMAVSDLKRMKELESELGRLKRMYADLALENRPHDSLENITPLEVMENYTGNATFKLST